MRWFMRRGLRVLMYHKTSASHSDEHTVTAALLERQLRWLRKEGFAFVTLAALARGECPANAVLVTFDDAYADTLQIAAPVLGSLGVPAVVFVPTAYVGRGSEWDRDVRPLLDATGLRDLHAAGWELALHSHRHANYAGLSAAEVGSDVAQAFATMKELGLPAVPALAYPYGGRPREAGARTEMQAALRAAGVALAFRVGNRINPLPLRAPMEIERLSVRGDESFEAFQRKVAWGRFL